MFYQRRKSTKMTKEEFRNFLKEGKEVYLESERITYYMCKDVIYVFKEYEHGNGITLGVLNLDAGLDYKNMKVKS
jgi:hypothetical protein